MTADIYYKVQHKDGRIEHYHFYAFSDDGVNAMLDLMNELNQRGKIKSLSGISRGDFMLNVTEKQGPIDIHLDLNIPNDAQGEKIAYMEHYEL